MKHVIKRRFATDPAMSPEQLLSDAVELLGLGYILAAAVLARAALDTHVRDWRAVLGLRPTKRDTWFEHLSQMRRVGVFDKDQVARILHLTDIGNRAAHNFQVLGSEVEDLVEGVGQLLAGEE
ncbi:MAG: hypothetical protein ACYC6N_18845 [Pirellulaceae bacterium]